MEIEENHSSIQESGNSLKMKKGRSEMKKKKKGRKIINWIQLIEEIKNQNLLDLHFLFSELGKKEIKERESFYGKRYYFLCPFHQEKNASCVYLLINGQWHCLGCGSGGSIIDYYMRRQGVDFHQAVIGLARIFKIKIKWGYSSDLVKVVLPEKIHLSLLEEDIPF